MAEPFRYPCVLPIAADIASIFSFALRRLKGAIKEIRRIDDLNAVVVYQHDSKNGLDADEFTYAVQGDGTAVSARAKVTLRVRPPTSQVEYPRTVAMGSIPAGLPSVAEIVFSTAGRRTHCSI